MSESERDVSRETVPGLSAPPPPASATEVFGDRLPLAVAYAELLAGEATVRGLVGPREVPRLWERHLLNCAVVTELVPVGSSVCDIGSGAGLPGIVLGIRRPDLQVTLVEPLLRRTTFLEQAVAMMELPNVAVRRGRAEDLPRDPEFATALAGGFDVVTSRAVAPLERLAGWSLPLTRPGGLVLAMKGASARDELARAGAEVGRQGGLDPRVHTLGASWVSPPTTVIAFTRTS